MEHARHTTLHALCLKCWRATGEELVYSYREQLEESCCLCGETTVGIVYLRKPAELMVCGGFGPAHRIGRGVHRKAGESFWKTTGIKGRHREDQSEYEEDTDDLEDSEV